MARVTAGFGLHGSVALQPHGIVVIEPHGSVLIDSNGTVVIELYGSVAIVMVRVVLGVIEEKTSWQCDGALICWQRSTVHIEA